MHFKTKRFEFNLSLQNFWNLRHINFVTFAFSMAFDCVLNFFCLNYFSHATYYKLK